MCSPRAAEVSVFLECPVEESDDTFGPLAAATDDAKPAIVCNRLGSRQEEDMLPTHPGTGLQFQLNGGSIGEAL